MSEEPKISAEAIEEVERLFARGMYSETYAKCTKMLEDDPLNEQCLPIMVCVLVELEKSSQLFSLAHKLVDKFPDLPLSWYTVGCYYYAIGQYDSAKKYLAKCTGMTPPYGAGWLIFGHAFAAEREHDQAMNCYLKAAKVLPDSHLPLLYIGLEYSLTNNLKLAEKFLRESLQMTPSDPYVLHELGTLAFRQKDYANADTHYRRALNLLTAEKSGSDYSSLDNKLKRLLPPVWEPLINNLGHVARKLGKLDEALAFHRKSLMLRPRQASTYGSLGLTYLMKGEFELGIECLLQSLSLKNEDGVRLQLLNSALELLDSHQWLWKDTSSWRQIQVPRLEPDESLLKLPNLPVGDRKRKSSSEMDQSNEKDLSLSGIDEVEMDSS